MPSKGHRSSSTGRLARTSSATKVTNNLQFTQKDLPVSKHSDKGKKSGGYANDKTPAFNRTSSSQRIHSREQMQPLRRHNPPPKANGGKPKAGFTITAAEDDDDDDEWVSSSSGVVTPSNQDSDSETASENDGSEVGALYAQHNQPPNRTGPSGAPTLQRVETARPSEFAPSTPKNEVRLPAPAAAAPSHTQGLHGHPSHADVHNAQLHHLQSQLRNLELESAKETRTDQAPPSRHGSRQSHSRRSSRPSSTYSFSSKSDVRPHPLIRGQSFGHLNVAKNSPLTPLTAAAPPQLSTSPSSSIHEDPRNFLPSSPASTSGGSFIDKTNLDHHRRTSFSSARSVATVPVQPALRAEQSRNNDRTRTLSTMSTSSSSAALSALSHLPAVTRPPSPQTIVFFPPVNPHANTENIHPLLPGPYLNNHLTVLSRRIPLRESYDRVIKAKQAL
ncbi:hypothetical protein CC1G_07360 [Coprinopsis cinerea okayama7|uniref:Uncharacterized protein n=1 Tax=Coprinopsis cinerea (strain Okayama-7 / 130 / ATCC MYA-4618 / FGSC 9003) TaxID=240176 RepID=A8N6I9_COPC7|nr:hypothetical protein CC1G_07360 [Coprinopsis cinerea okayama7\|eukprot:XP_001830445.2 hypothetical protein CC1G_07360 [Coprinopsis cinerea okayama7\